MPSVESIKTTSLISLDKKRDNEMWILNVWGGKRAVHPIPSPPVQARWQVDQAAPAPRMFQRSGAAKPEDLGLHRPGQAVRAARRDGTAGEGPKRRVDPGVAGRPGQQDGQRQPPGQRRKAVAWL